MQGASFLFTITWQSLHLVQAAVAEWDQSKTGVHISSGSIFVLFFLHIFFSVFCLSLVRFRETWLWSWSNINYDVSVI